MTNQINDLPKESSFGLNFNYSVWTPGSQVTLCNVRWNSDYRDIVYFKNRAALDAHITDNSGDTVSIGSMTYVRPDHSVRINTPFNAAYKYNYLRVYNPAQPVPGSDYGRSFYFFILDVRYVAPNTTELVIQLDAWQTFCHEVKFGSCYVERGHIGIANANQFDDNGRTYLTVPEGLDVGGEYVIAREYEKKIASVYEGGDGGGYGIVMTTTITIADGIDPGTVDAPKLYAAGGSRYEGIPNGTELFYFPSVLDFESFMRTQTTRPWITQGIASITAIPRLSTSQISQFVRITDAAWIGGNANRYMYKMYGDPTPAETITLRSNFRNDINLGRYARLKKFLTYPYTIIELTCFTGSPVVLKPESVNTADLNVVKVSQLAPSNPRIVFFPKGYNAPKGDTGTWSGDALDITTGIYDLPRFSVVNDSYTSFLAANKNSIAYARTSADWSQQKTMAGANVARDQAGHAMFNQRQVSERQINAAQQSTALQNSVAAQRAMAGIAGSAISAGTGAMVGGPMGAGAAIGAVGGAAMRSVDTAITINANNQSTAINNAAQRDVTTLGIQQQQYMADTNFKYANMAAVGDYANTIAGINAKVQDAQMLQPTTSGQMGGEIFNLVSRGWGVYARVKTVQAGVMTAIGEFWLRYGYAVNRFAKIPSNYAVMDKFTYWQLKETYIESATCPESFKQVIRGIFEKGVTVWAQPAQIGSIDLADNAPLEGITL